MPAYGLQVLQGAEAIEYPGWQLMQVVVIQVSVSVVGGESRPKMDFVKEIFS